MPELTLFHGDCLQVMKGLPDQSVDLIICDLPYGCLSGGYRSTGLHPQTNNSVNTSKKVFTTKPCNWDIAIDLVEFWREVKRIRRNEHTPCIHFATTKFGYDLIHSNPDEFRYDLVWDKQRGVSFLQANKMPMRSHEMMYVFSAKGAYYQRMGDTQCPKSVIQIHTEKHRDRHPTQKPMELYKWLIQRYCPIGGTVLDPTFGSANSVFTAYSLGRDAIGIEMDEGFFKKAEERMNALP